MRRFYENPGELALAFAKAWFKLTHRDIGPISRYLGPEVPAEPQIWQDPVPPTTGEPLTDEAIEALETAVLRGCDGGAAGVHRVGVRLDVPRHGQAGRRQRRPHPAGASGRSGEFNRARVARGCPVDAGTGAAGVGSGISLADLIVLGGCAAVEQAAREAGVAVEVPFSPGRTDASQELTDVEAFAVLEPTADGFRNFLGKGHRRPAERLLINRARLLNLTAPETTVLVGGLRVLGANAGSSAGRVHLASGQPHERLLREPARSGHRLGAHRRIRGVVRGARRCHRRSEVVRERVDLLFGSNSILRALAEVYARRRRQGEVRPRLRGRMEQGHEPRPVRSDLISTSPAPCANAGRCADRTEVPGRADPDPGLRGDRLRCSVSKRGASPPSVFAGPPQQDAGHDRHRPNAIASAS